MISDPLLVLPNGVINPIHRFKKKYISEYFEARLHMNYQIKKQKIILCPVENYHFNMIVVLEQTESAFKVSRKREHTSSFIFFNKENILPSLLFIYHPAIIITITNSYLL